MSQHHDSPFIPFHMEMNFTHGEPKEVRPNIRRVVATNSGKLTHNGTNSYIVGKGDVAIIDPGPDDEAHISALLDATVGETISHIFLTHRHRDHSGAIAKLKQKTGAETAAFPLDVFTSPEATTTGGPSENDYFDFEFEADMNLSDGQQVSGKSWGIEALHTPGHAPDHLCFYLAEQKVILTGDHIMAWNTSVIIPPFGRMSDYLSSLKKLMDFDCDYYLPGHGGMAREPRRLAKAFLMHRRWREQAILDHVRNGHHSAIEIVPKLYPKMTSSLERAAALSVLSHLEHLVEQNVLSSSGAPGLEQVYSLFEN